jgi:hypothetical protein
MKITRSPNVAQGKKHYLIHPQNSLRAGPRFLTDSSSKNVVRPNCGARLGNADRDCQGKNKISAEMLLYVYDERFTQRNLHQKAMIAFLDGVSGVSMA